MTVVDVCILRPDRKRVCPKWLLHKINSDDFRREISYWLTGSTRQRISRGNLSKIEFYLPSFDEQRRIAAILDKADALRRKRKRAVELLNSITQSIFSEVFGERESWLRSGKVASLFEVCSPKQWKTISSSDLKQSGYPVYGANGKIGYYSEFNHEHETVLITCRGATCGTINVSEPRSYVTGNAMALDDLNTRRVNLEYLAAALRVRKVNDAITGTAQPQITRQSLAVVTLPLPDLKLQERYAELCGSIRLSTPQFEHSAQRMESLFSSLQHRAFSGQL